MRHPELKVNIPAQVFCMSWCSDFEFRVTHRWLDCDEPCDYTGRVGAGDSLMWAKGKLPDVASP